MKQLAVCLIVHLIVAIFTTASGQDIIFNQLQSGDDILHYSVNSLYKDERGFIWIGSRNGLSLYNGSYVKTFKYDKNNPNSLSGNNIQKIAGNGRGKVFLKSSDEISVYDFYEETFKTIPRQNCKAVYYHKGLYFASDNRVEFYNDSTEKITVVVTLPDSSAVISALYINNDSCWIGTTNRGLFLRTGNEFKNIIPDANITTIFNDTDNTIWVGSWENGAYSIKSGHLTNFRYKGSTPGSINSDFVRDFCQDNQGNIWMGTFKGLSVYNKTNDSFINYTPNQNPGSLSHSSVWALITDNQGTIWIGTYFGGVNFFNPEYEIFTRYRYSTNPGPNELSSPVIGMMTEDKHHNLWICTDGGGVNVLDRKNRTIKSFVKTNSSNSISHNNVKAIYYDEQKDLMWIGTHLGGLNKLEIKTGRITRYQNINANIISHIIPYKENLLLATHNGVCHFDPVTGKSTIWFTSAFNGRMLFKINYLHIDHTGTLWIAGKSLFSYNFTTKQLKEYTYNRDVKNGICNNNITCIFEDSNKNLWFGSDDSGFDRYRRKTDDFENFDVSKNGLISNCIYKIGEFEHDNLIISTDKGLSVFSPAKREFTNYGIGTGIPLTTTNALALYKTTDNEVFVGGVDGLISFRASNLKFESKPYAIYPVRLVVNGQEVIANDNSGILRKSITNTQKITLNASQSVFSIEFTTTNFVPLNNTEIIYKLEGFSDNWNTIRGQNIITYTNLNPGTYTLIIKPKNKEDLCKEAYLTIQVLPPFYKTIWAYLFYGIIFILIAGYLNNIYKTRIKLKESLKYEQKRVEDVEKLNQSKLNFFTNISHEFRTPLTLIIGQLEMLLQAKSFIPGIYNRILAVYNNSLQLRELISELLDFRKQELGQMKILVSENNIAGFLSENYHLFQEYSKSLDIDFTFTTPTKNLLLWYDSRQLQKVINNLLSNAFKNTPKGGSVAITLIPCENQVCIEIADTGVGINPEEINKIFDLFYQSETNPKSFYSGTGIGLALTRTIIELHHGKIEVKSIPGQGTKFTITLKKGNAHFTKEQLCKKTEEERNSGDYCEALPELPTSEIDIEQSRITNAKLLIVEDNKALREMLNNLFEPFYTVFEAADGESGLATAIEMQPDIIVSDVVMPTMSGIELCKSIKNNIDTCHIPVVLLTARTAIEHNLEGLRIGADDYITKPFNVNLLLTRCNNLVNSRIILQEKFSNLPQTPMHILATNAMDKEIMDKATLIIEKHIDNVDFNIDLFAQEMGMARTKLFSKLKAITGQTPFDFLSTVKLKKAALMLKNNPELNISEISDRLGFNTPRYFSKCFKDKYHVIPQIYRKNYQMELKKNTSAGNEDV